MSTCFRLRAVRWDLRGERLFVVSDNQQKGEIWVLKKKQ